MAQFYNLLFLIFAVAFCVEAKPQSDVFTLVSFQLVIYTLCYVFKIFQKFLLKLKAKFEDYYYKYINVNNHCDLKIF